jgi:hypothetical protein
MLIPVMMKVSVAVHEARNFVRSGDGAPAVVHALAGKSEMQSKIDVGMRLGVVGGLRKPRARNHDAG